MVQYSGLSVAPLFEHWQGGLHAGRSEPVNHLGPGIQKTFTISTQTIVSKVNTIERNPVLVFPPWLKLL